MTPPNLELQRYNRENMNMLINQIETYTFTDSSANAEHTETSKKAGSGSLWNRGIKGKKLAMFSDSNQDHLVKSKRICQPTLASLRKRNSSLNI
jgi:hypothetical protein